MPPPPLPTLADLFQAQQDANGLLQKLVNLMPGALHQERIPLKIYGIAASGSANKVVVGSWQARRIVNLQLDSTTSSGQGVLRELWSGFDTDRPFVINASSVNINIAFSEDVALVANETVTLPPGYIWWEGVISAVGPLAGAAQLLGTVRLQDGIGAALGKIATPADAFAAPGATALQVQTFLEAFNNATWDQVRTASAANLAAFSGLGALLAALPGQWTVVHAPAANTIATATKGAGAAGVRHICTGIFASLVAGAVAPAAATSVVNMRDGASGAGTILFSQPVSVQALAGDRDNIEVAGLNIVGSAATAMTLEFTAAGGANTIEAVTIVGYDAS